MAQHVGTDPLRGDTCGGGQLLHQLIEPNAAKIIFARREQPGTFSRDMRQPRGNGGPRPIRYRHQPLTRALALQNQERPIRCQRATGQGYQFGSP